MNLESGRRRVTTHDSRRTTTAPFDEPVLWPVLALLLLYALFFVEFAVRLSAFPFDLDQGETYDAWSGWLLNLGQLPYTDGGQFPYYSHGYPPLWSYLVSIPMAWLGPGLGAARAVSSLTALATAVVLGLAAWRHAHRISAGLLAAGFFLSSPYVFHTTALARVNACMVLVSVVALWLLEVPTRRRVPLGALALMAALFTKPTAIDAVAAGLGSLLMVRPRQAILALLVLLLSGGTLLLGLQLASHGTYVQNVLSGNTSPFELEQLRDYGLNFGALHLLLLMLAVAEVVVRVRHRDWSPWALYLPAALLLALVTVGKTGAGESYFLATIAAASVLAAQRIGALVGPRGGPRGAEAPFGVVGGWSVSRRRVEALLALVLLGQLLVLAHGPLSDVVAWLPDRGPQAAILGHAPTADDLAAGRELAELVRRAPGLALSEDASFVVVSGKPLVGATPPSLRNLYHAGLWNPTPMVDDLRAHRYAIVVLNAELYPEPILAAIGQFYFQERAVHMNGSTYRVFLPGSG
jgi:hypothetical protein